MINPLTSIQFAVPFDKIEAAHVEPAVEQLLASAEEAIDAIACDGEARTYDSTAGALERATETLEWAMGVIGHLEAVATTPALRRVYNEVKPRVSAFFSEIPLHAGLYKALCEFAATDEAKSLSPTRRRFLEKTLREFRRHGAELPPDKKKQLSEIDVALSKATTIYAQNVLDATNAFELIVTDDARLSGLPDSIKAAAGAAAIEKGKTGYRFTLQGPSLVPALTYLDDAGLREELWVAHNTRATWGEFDNRALVSEILSLRREKAVLLGYRNFADLVLEERMAKTGASARDFVEELRNKTQRCFEEENDELLRFARETTGVSSLELNPWDIAYYAEKFRRDRFALDEEELRQYFPADRVVQGLFETVARLYGVRVESSTMPAWNEDVRAYAVLAADGSHQGSFYLDLYPREDKRGGAWMMGILQGAMNAARGRFDPHLGLFCANVNPPLGDRPALLTHREVETLFHEFGHLMHHLMSEVEVKSLAGTNVAWDFVELPSQIMENWCWEKEALDLFARHHETDAPIPDALFDRMSRARTFRAANAQMRQLGFAAVDLALHMDWTPADGDPIALSRKFLLPFSPTRLPEPYGLMASFGHLFASSVAYAAGYYSYKWAEVLDADAFGRFRREGIFSRTAGQAFADAILKKGDSEDPAELYRAFMGRDPELRALMVRQGLS